MDDDKAREQGAQQERERLRKAVEAITPSCHSHSGLDCEKDEFGWCHLIDRADVLALLADPEDK